MPEAASPATLEAFELAVARGEREAALGLALGILKAVDDRYGRLDAIGGPGPDAERRVEKIATRFCRRVRAADLRPRDAADAAPLRTADGAPSLDPADVLDRRIRRA